MKLKIYCIILSVVLLFSSCRNVSAVKDPSYESGLLKIDSAYHSLYQTLYETFFTEVLQGTITSIDSSIGITKTNINLNGTGHPMLIKYLGRKSENNNEPDLYNTEITLKKTLLPAHGYTQYSPPHIPAVPDACIQIANGSITYHEYFTKSYAEITLVECLSEDGTYGTSYALQNDAQIELHMIPPNIFLSFEEIFANDNLLEKISDKNFNLELLKIFTLGNGFEAWYLSPIAYVISDSYQEYIFFPEDYTYHRKDTSEFIDLSDYSIEFTANTLYSVPEHMTLAIAEYEATQKEVSLFLENEPDE